MTDKATEARNAAGQYFKDGYNCSEAVLRAATDVLGVPVDEQQAEEQQTDEQQVAQEEAQPAEGQTTDEQ